MSLDSRRPSRGGSGQDLWPKWMWVAVPVLVVVVVAGLWWAIFSPSPSTEGPTPTATMALVPTQPSRSATSQVTLAINTMPAETRPLLVPVATFTPTSALIVTTPTGQVPTVQPTSATATELGIGAKAKVVGTGGAGLNMRAGAGTGHARVKTLPEGETVEIIGGPKEANGYTWWQVRDAAGTSGWVASQFLSLGKE
ncbi:MAG: SH3 domain-containing protein [Chloroflexi bacterium]|nr:SH3 domain-containing protein [Chloroflexota bacterium]